MRKKISIILILSMLILLMTACGKMEDSEMYPNSIKTSSIPETKEENNLTSYSKFKILDVKIEKDIEYDGRYSDVKYETETIYISYLDESNNQIYFFIKNNFREMKNLKIFYTLDGESYIEQFEDASVKIYINPEMSSNIF